MTDKPMTAKEYLSQYKMAMHDVEILRLRNEELRARAEGIGSTLHVPTGKTTEGEEVPLLRSQHDPKAKERLLCVLATQSMECEQREAEALQLAKRIMSDISWYTDDVYRQILILRYIELKTYKAIAEVLNYSTSHVRRLHNEALNMFGDNMHNSKA